jgi:hypothetical protein
MPNEIGDATTVTVPAPGTPGPGYAVTINAAIEELQTRVAQRADNGSIAQMPAGTVKANLTGALADAQDVTLAALVAALGVSGGGYPVIVEDIGVATGNTGAANELALRTHMTANPSTPYAYQFGPGTYNFDKNALAGDPGRGSIYITDTMAARRFFGQGRGVTTLAYGGLGNSGEWNLFYAVGGSSARFEVSDMDLHCTGITNPDAGNQHHLINVAAVSAHGTSKIRENIRVSKVNFRSCIGAGFRTLGEPLVGNYVQGYAVTDCDFSTAGIGFGSRSCLELQRGSRSGLYANIYAKGARNSVFDSEITSGGSADNLIFHNCTFDGITASSSNVFSLGGSSVPGSYRGVNWILSNVVTLGGYVGIFYTYNVKFFNCRFEYTPGLNIGVDAFMNSALAAAPLTQVRGENDLLAFYNCVWTRGVGAVAPSALFDVQALATPTQRSFRVELHQPTFIESSVTPATAVVSAGDVDDLTITGMRVVSGATSNFVDGADCVRWFSVTATACTQMALHGLTVSSAGGLMRQLVNVAAGTGITLGTVDIVGVNGTGIINPAKTSGSVVVFDMTGTGTINENPLLDQVRSPGQYTWIAANSASDKIFPVVAGSRGARTHKTLESYVTAPNTKALGAPGDFFLYRPTVQTFELWVKKTQTSSAVLTQDRNNWVLLTSSTNTGSTSGAATVSVPRNTRLRDIRLPVVDPTVTATSRIQVDWAPTVDTDENTPEFSPVLFAATAPDVGTFDVKLVSTDTKPLSGDYKILYQVSN